MIKNLEEKSLKQCIQKLRVELFELEQEKGSLLENSDWQMRTLEEKIGREDAAIYKLSQEYDSLKGQLADLTKLMKQ